MLKACWDCMMGSGANQEGSYGTQLNGGSESVPLRPVRQTDRNMFVIPRALRDGDKLVVSGTMNNDNRFTANLLTGLPNPDYNNIACQVDTDFQNGQIALRVIEDGQQDWNPKTAPASMISGPKIAIEFVFQDQLMVFINESNVDRVELRHDINKITFLEVNGLNVQNLSFQFDMYLSRNGWYGGASVFARHYDKTPWILVTGLRLATPTESRGDKLNLYGLSDYLRQILLSRHCSRYEGQAH